VLQTCRELGIGITAYGVLSRGLISGHWTAQRVGEADFRGQTSPRFQAENLDHNLALVEKVRTIAAELGVSVAQVAIAWVAAQGQDIVPLVGARTRTRLEEALASTRLVLSPADLARLEQAVPAGAAAGGRYHPHMVHTLDSENN